MLAFRLALQTFDAIGVRYLDSQLVKKKNKTFKHDSQQHHPKPHATSPLQSAVRDHFRTGGHNTKLGPVGEGISPSKGHHDTWDAAFPHRLPPSPGFAD
jgi:hypothetical protein